MQCSKYCFSKMLLASFLAANLAGCTAVDAYSSRASIYNEQASDQKSDMILKNILRSAYNEPLQFTDVSSISGTASSSFTLGASAPLTGIRGTGTELTSLSPSGTISGGPTFNVANLSTQEFYEGLQTPISTQLIANYLSEGYEPYILYPLAISQIEFSDGKTRRTYTSGTSPEGFNTFIGILRGLINAGMRMEQIDDNKAYGAVLNGLQASDPYLLGHIATALGTSKDAPVGLQHVMKDGKPVDGKYEFTKKGTQFRFCFDEGRSRSHENTINEAPGAFTEKANDESKVKVIFEGDVANQPPFILDKENRCNQNGPAKQAGGKVGLRITTRSVEAMINFVGDIVNTELGLAGDAPQDLTIVPRDGKGLIHLFNIHTGQKIGSDITASLHGKIYSITPDPSGRDYSSLVVQVITDLLALESSAKAFPAPNVITLVP